MLEVIKLQYIDVDILELFIYFLFQKRSKDKVLAFGLDEEADYFAHSEMSSFNARVRTAIADYGLEKVFYMPEAPEPYAPNTDASKLRDSQRVNIELKNERQLRTFLKNYVDEFRNNTLKTTNNLIDHLIFLKQLEYMERELKYKYQHAMAFYNTTEFQITDEFETFINIPDKIRSEMRPIEFILYLIFNKTEYVQLKEVDMHAPHSIFGISLRLDFLRPIEELFEELRTESSADNYHGYKFKPMPKGKVEIRHITYQGVGMLSHKAKERAFKYFLDNNGTTHLELHKVAKTLEIESKIPSDTLIKYIESINSMLRQVYKIEDKAKRFVIPGDKIKVKIR